MSETIDPELKFGDPGRLADDKSLTIGEKLEILEDWKMDLIEMQRAEEENMPSARRDEGETAGKLADVSKVIAKLRQPDGPAD